MNICTIYWLGVMTLKLTLITIDCSCWQAEISLHTTISKNTKKKKWKWASRSFNVSDSMLTLAETVYVKCFFYTWQQPHCAALWYSHASVCCCEANLEVVTSQPDSKRNNYVIIMKLFVLCFSLSLSQPEVDSRVNGVSSPTVQDRGPHTQNSGETQV